MGGQTWGMEGVVGSRHDCTQWKKRGFGEQTWRLCGFGRMCVNFLFFSSFLIFLPSPPKHLHHTAILYLVVL